MPIQPTELNREPSAPPMPVLFPPYGSSFEELYARAPPLPIDLDLGAPDTLVLLISGVPKGTTRGKIVKLLDGCNVVAMVFEPNGEVLVKFEDDEGRDKALACNGKRLKDKRVCISKVGHERAAAVFQSENQDQLEDNLAFLQEQLDSLTTNAPADLLANEPELQIGNPVPTREQRGRSSHSGNRSNWDEEKEQLSLQIKKMEADLEKLNLTRKSCKKGIETAMNHERQRLEEDFNGIQEKFQELKLEYEEKIKKLNSLIIEDKISSYEAKITNLKTLIVHEGDSERRANFEKRKKEIKKKLLKWKSELEKIGKRINEPQKKEKKKKRLSAKRVSSTSEQKPMEKVLILEEKPQRDALKKSMKTKITRVAVCFLVDVTAFTRFWIHVIREEMQNILQLLEKIYPSHGFSLAFVGYRDNVSMKPIELIPFGSDNDQFFQLIRTVKCKDYLKYGESTNDRAEDVLNGLKYVSELGWDKFSTRILFHIADAPGHGTCIHDLNVSDDGFKQVNDMYPDTPLALYEEMLAKVQKKVQNYFFIKVREPKGDIVDKMAKVFCNIFHNEKKKCTFCILEDLVNDYQKVEKFKDILLRSIQDSVPKDTP